MDCRFKSKNHALSSISALFAVLLMSIISANIVVAEEASKGMSIYGQSELPKALYIVPWKRKEASVIDMPNSKSLASDVLEPIDPEVFRRQIRYYDLLTQHQSDETEQE